MFLPVVAANSGIRVTFWESGFIENKYYSAMKTTLNFYLMWFISTFTLKQYRRSGIQKLLLGGLHPTGVSVRNTY